jgi:predicted transcriptional regulator
MDGFTSAYVVYMEGKATLTISIRMSPEMRDRLQALADKEERTLSWFCMKVLRDYLRALDKKEKPNG